MKRLTVIFLTLIVSSCTPCDDPYDERFDSIMFRVVDGAQDVFNTEDARKSLHMISLERQQGVDFVFSGSSFSISESIYDDMAVDALICPSYVLTYGTNIDTLKVCYQIEPDKCEGSRLKDVKVFWNQRVMDYSGNVATIIK